MQHNLAAEQLLHIEPGLLTNFLQTVATVTNNDLLLTIALNQNQGMNMQNLALLFELLNFDGNLIRDLGAQLAHDFLAHQLCSQETGAAVSKLIFRVEVFTLGQTLGDQLLQ